MHKVSVVIVTKNRQNDLLECLGSLAAQTHKIDELIVVDNSSTDHTAQLVRNFSKAARFHIRYVLEKRSGYPTIYNRGLDEAAHDWVAFIDDDCIASLEWYSNVKKAIKAFPNFAAILGKSNTYYITSLFSQITAAKEYLWKSSVITDNVITDLEILDNKNIVYNLKYLKEKKIRFDESRVGWNNGASEDCDLGMQIEQSGGLAISVSNIEVLHKDPQNSTHYYRKLFSSLKSHQQYEKKWSTFRNKKKKISLFTNYNHLVIFFQENSFNYFRRFSIAFHLAVSFIFSRIYGVR